MIGHLINERFQIESELGQGGMGAVYQATDVLLERQVAVKVLSAAALGTESRTRLLREARAAARLNHPNVVQLFDAGETLFPGDEDPVPYIVMELVEGPTLHERGVRDFQETIQFAIQVCAALDHAHSHGIVHRDLKPENILIAPGGTAKLMDFGLARAGSSRLTQAGTIVGTVLYLAPELAMGQEFDGRADLYALGVMLYELTTGEAPFTADDPLAVISQHLHTPAPSPQSLNPAVTQGLDRLILRLLRKDPADRPASAGEVKQALESLVAVKDEVRAQSEAETQAPQSIARTREPAGLPAFLKDPEGEPVNRPVFVARQREFSRLNHFLENALGSRGGVVFISGGAGSGKSALMQAFARQAGDRSSDWLVAIGHCNAYTGAGDPYLPFREITSMLTGDVEARWSAGLISTNQARRLWKAVPHTAKAILDSSPNLLDVFVPGSEVLERTTAALGEAPDWLAELQALAEQDKPLPGELEQVNLFQQFAGLLRHVSQYSPLLLLLDDLQWADAASINLLFHLARRLEGERILLLGAYRPDEVAMGRGETRHPLEKPLAELKRQFGEIFIDLGEGEAGEGLAFIDAYLDNEPNQLGPGFRQALFEHTRGHPLFTIELLRSLQERGDLVLNDAGRWVEVNGLDWGEIPARVEGVIEERIGRLDEELRETLEVASVAGETFSAEVVADVLERDERSLLRSLNVLEARHRLVREAGESKIGSRILSQYTFTHTMFQQFLYSRLSRGQQRLLHGQMAEILESIYGDQSEEASVQLARHFQKAGETGKAVEYLLQAGDAARSAYALQEAGDLYQGALSLLKEAGDLDRAARTLMKLGLTYHNDFKFDASRRAYQDGFALWRQAGQARAPASVQPAPHALRFAAPEFLPVLDPGMAPDEYSNGLIRQLFSGLVQMSSSLDVLPDLADSWEVLDSGRKYIFRLRENLFWNDGEPLSATDFVYAWTRILDPAIGSPNAIWFYDIKGGREYHQGKIKDPTAVGVQAPNERTLVVELANPASYFLELLAYEASFPVPRHTVQQFGEAWTENSNLVSSGPFRLAERSPKKSVFVRNERYHGEVAGNVASFELHRYAGESDKVRADYLAGALDVIPEVSFALPSSDPQAAAWQAGLASDYISGPDLSTFYIGFNCRLSPFDDVRVRQAFAMSIDRRSLADAHMGGSVDPAGGGYLPPGIPGHMPDVGLPYDPEGAQRLLAEAGYPGGLSFPKTVMATNIGRERPCEFLTAGWRRTLEIDIRPRYVEWEIFLAQVMAEGSLYAIAWTAAFLDPTDFLIFSEFQDRTGWQNEAFNRSIEEARTSLDQSRRLELYRQADRLLIQQAAVVPIFYQRFHALVKPWVKHYQENRPLKDVVIEPH